jgi:hypothetical protein
VDVLHETGLQPGAELKVEVDQTVAEHAAVLRARHPSIRPSDALVLGDGEALSADEILTGDRRWRRFDASG